MKILPVNLIREADAYTIKHNPIRSIDLMERAADACVEWILDNYKDTEHFEIYCGQGNNGGDGLAIARMLCEKEYDVYVHLVKTSSKPTKDYKINLDRLTDELDVRINQIDTVRDLKEFHYDIVIIDAIFGTGISKPVEGLTADVINYINKLEYPVISVDIPSGLYCDTPVDAANAIINATYTLSFQFPKLAFMFEQNFKYVGKFRMLGIGLNDDFIEETETKNHFSIIDDVKEIYRPRKEMFVNKGTFGHALLICGSLGKMGAAVLSAKACLRTGAGMLTVHCPASGNLIMQISIPEAMVDLDEDQNKITSIKNLFKYDTIGIGPGIGTDASTQEAFRNLLLNIHKPLVIDADALNILSLNNDILYKVPANSILTPHKKEFERLFGISTNDFERNTLQREMSVKYNIYIVLKGAQTAITTPQGDCYFNSSGTQGMATAGSGDVLTGVITGLLAQGYEPKDAALLGVFLHGLAGEHCLGPRSLETMLAGDIIEHLSQAYFELNDDLTFKSLLNELFNENNNNDEEDEED
ncbi:MAG: NAD(P)H-hydrate dehydratase [Bacteroidota bacterium]